MREFQIRAADVDYLGVTFLPLKPPLAVTYWPAGIDDDCRGVQVAQGFLSDSATFDPSRWHRISNQVP